MADSKISALPASTVPLAGTEVLPIVQSSATKQVSVANLTAGRAVATGALTVTGDATLSTGNLVPSTAAKGINFTANTPTAGMTSQLLNWYEEGTWTPSFEFATPGTSTFTYAVRNAYYTKIGRNVCITCFLLVTTNNFVKGTASGQLSITGLPFANYINAPVYYYLDLNCNAIDYTASNLVLASIDGNGTSLRFETVVVLGALVKRGGATLDASSFAATNANGAVALQFTLTYTV
jgi:hypothetical protein